MTLRYIYNYYLDTCWHPSNYISLNFTKLTLEKLRSISSIIIIMVITKLLFKG